ncbi:MAG TPA: very short patch repair endonuclease [Mycobacteriales bacterium]|jgi:DNA mismatch endonuclease (patch repair protein)
MQLQRTRDTGPELAVRRRLHAIGYRYRVDAPPLAGLRRRGDIVFTRARVVVFIDGCYWHGCPDHGREPQSNQDYWSEKLKGNRTRDADTDDRLRTAGWHVIRCWEHEPVPEVVRQIANAVEARRGGSAQSAAAPLREPGTRGGR